MKINSKMIFTKLLCVILPSVILFGCNDPIDYNSNYDNTTATTAVVQKLVADTKLIGHILSDSSYPVVTGVEAVEVAYVSYEGFPTRMFIFEVDLNSPGVSIAASLPDNDTNFKMQQMTQQALAADSHSNMVWGGVNADFFNTSTGVPRGPVHQGGVMLKNTFDSGERSVFYITNDNTAAVAHRDDYPDINASGVIREAVGGGVMLITDGETVVQTDNLLEPRTAVGVSEDGKTVWFLVVDGRYWSYSNGMRYEELAIHLKSLGAYNAINLDGGGSSTFFIRTTPDFADDRFQIRNLPSDNGGKERAVGDGLLIISNQ